MIQQDLLSLIKKNMNEEGLTFGEIKELGAKQGNLSRKLRKLVAFKFLIRTRLNGKSRYFIVEESSEFQNGKM